MSDPNGPYACEVCAVYHPTVEGRDRCDHRTTTPTPDAICERLQDEAFGVLRPLLTEAISLIQQQQATIERLSAALEKYEGPLAGSWFYPEGDTSSDACCLSPYEVLDERYFDWEGPRTGVFPIDRAASLPTIYAAVQVYSEAEKDERDSDDEYTATFHRTEDEARTALGKDAK